jgi:hypothetical protein
LKTWVFSAVPNPNDPKLSGDIRVRRKSKKKAKQKQRPSKSRAKTKQMRSKSTTKAKQNQSRSEVNPFQNNRCPIFSQIAHAIF